MSAREQRLPSPEHPAPNSTSRQVEIRPRGRERWAVGPYGATRLIDCGALARRGQRIPKKSSEEPCGRYSETAAAKKRAKPPEP